MSNNYSNNNQHRKQRYQGGGGGDYRSGGGNNRPRKNYSASREKYLAQARDALASGDRVLAENYLQHADHCYRMMMEEGFRPNNNNARPAQPADGNAPTQAPAEEMQPEEIPAGHGSQLPAFITAAVPAQAAPVQNWEERDEA